MEERSLLSQLAYEAKYGSEEEDSMPVRRRLFSASAIDDATVEDRVDELVKFCYFAVFSSLVASRCSSAPFLSPFMLVLCFYACRLLPVAKRPKPARASRQPRITTGIVNGQYEAANSSIWLLEFERERELTAQVVEAKKEKERIREEARKAKELAQKLQERSSERLESLRC